MENKNNKLLIGIIVVLAVALLGVFIYMVYDKGLIFNNEKDNTENNQQNTNNENIENNGQNNTSTENTQNNQQGAIEAEITDSNEKAKLESIVALLNSESLNFIKGNVKLYSNLKLTDLEKLQITMRSLKDKNKFVSRTIANDKVNVSNNQAAIVTNNDAKQIDIDCVKNEYRSLFNEELNNYTDINNCPSYYYDSVNSVYYEVSACGGIGDGSQALSYINKYTSKGNETYVKISLGYIERQGETNTFKVYTSLEKNNVYQSINDNNFVIDQNNYTNFSEYKLTFGKNADGSYYFKSVEKIK